LKVQKASNERNAVEVRIEQYISLELLGKGKLIARGIPNEAPPHDNEQIVIKPAQWQYLRLSVSSRAGGFGDRQAGDAVDSKGATVQGRGDWKGKRTAIKPSREIHLPTTHAAFASPKRAGR
jgi:hypothetical protein